MERQPSASVLEIPGQCFACGRGTDAATCPNCATTTEIAPAQADRYEVRLGYLKRGKRTPLVLGFEDAASNSSWGIWPSGECRAISRSEFDRLAPIRNARVSSLAATLLLVAERARIQVLLADDQIDRAIVDTVLQQDLPEARRAAIELGKNGLIHKIDLLPLATHERSWWRAVSRARRHEFDKAVDELTALPVEGYPAANALLAACRNRASASQRDIASDLLERRLAANGLSAVEGAAAAAGLETSAVALLVSGGEGWAVPTEVAEAAPSASLLDFVLRPTAHARPLVVTSEAPLDIIDDAIDRGARLDAESFRNRPEDREYLIARTRPGELSDIAVEQLGFHDELVRRRLVRGDPVPSNLDESTVDEYLAGLVRLASGDGVAPAVRARHPALSAQLEDFLPRPEPDTLTEDLAGDETLWPRLSAALGPEAIGWNPARGTNARRFLAWHWLGKGCDRLFEAQWGESLEMLRHAFRLSDSEALRDEALNLMACAHWQLGNDEEAQQALTAAIEGSRNPSLQVNLGVVAAGLDPEVAALELARLVNEAQSLELRTVAAMKAVSLWLTDEVPWGSDRDDGMPEPLTLALRDLVVEPISIESFRQIAKLQSIFDDEWVAGGGWSASPHRDSAEERIYRARAIGPQELVEALVTELRKSSPPEWIADERDSLVEMFIRHAIDEDASGGGLFAFIAIERGLPLTPEQRAMLVPLAVHGVCDYFAESDNEGAPSDKFTTMLTEGEREARHDGLYERLEGLYTSAWRRLAVVQAVFASKMLDQAIDAFNNVMQRISGLPRRRINMGPVREMMTAIRGAAIEVQASLRPFPPHIDGDVAEFVRDVQSSARELAKRAEEVLR